MTPMTDDLGVRLAALEALLAALPPGSEAEGGDAWAREAITHQMEQLFAQPGGAAALVARYGGDQRVGVLRSLAFLLAGAVNQRDQAQALGGTVLALIEALQTRDPWPRLNLCTAVQRCLLFKVPLFSAEAPPSPALLRLLREGLAGPPALRATAATVVADLFYRKLTPAFPPADIRDLRERLLALVDDEDEATRKEARDLRDFLG